MHIEVRPGTGSCKFTPACAGMLLTIVAVDPVAERPELAIDACEAHREVAIAEMGAAMHAGIMRNAWAPTSTRSVRKAAIRSSMKRPPDVKIIDVTMNEDADVMGFRLTTPAPTVVNFLVHVAKRTLDPRAFTALAERLDGIESADARLALVRSIIFAPK